MTATKKSQYTPIPLVGRNGTHQRSFDESHDSEMTIETVADRSVWQVASITSEEATRVVGIIQSVYDECLAAHRSWSADLLAQRDKVLTVRGDDGTHWAEIQKRSAIEDEWKTRVSGPIHESLVRHGWEPTGQATQIAHAALGGDRGDPGIGSTSGGGILAADAGGKDVGFRGSLMTVIWSMNDRAKSRGLVT